MTRLGPIIRIAYPQITQVEVSGNGADFFTDVFGEEWHIRFTWTDPPSTLSANQSATVHVAAQVVQPSAPTRFVARGMWLQTEPCLTCVQPGSVAAGYLDAGYDFSNAADLSFALPAPDNPLSPSDQKLEVILSEGNSQGPSIVATYVYRWAGVPVPTLTPTPRPSNTPSCSFLFGCTATPTASPSGSISCGQTVNGVLLATDLHYYNDDTVADLYAFSLPSTTAVEVRMQPGGFFYSFTEYVEVTTSDDDGTACYGRSPQRCTLPAGDYVIVASHTGSVPASGDYTLALLCDVQAASTPTPTPTPSFTRTPTRTKSPPPSVPPTRTPTLTPTVLVDCGDRIAGTLGPGDLDYWGDGTWSDLFEFHTNTAKRVLFRIDAVGFTPDVSIGVRTGGELPRDDIFQPDEYLIIVSNFYPLAPGTYGYTLNVDCPDGPTRTPTHTPTPTRTPTPTPVLPSISGISPNLARQGTRNLELIIDGANFRPGAVITFQPAAGITLIPADPPAFGFDGPTRLRQRINIETDAPIGPRQVFVTNPDGHAGGLPPANRFTVTTSGLQPCYGDCNRDGTITVDEILTGINIGLGASDLSGCLAFDGNGDHQVTIDEILVSINGALIGCIPLGSPVPVATKTPTPGTGTGPCCVAASGEAGCPVSECAQCVCTADPFCCGTVWDDECAARASGCPACACPTPLPPTPGPPPSGDCCEAHSGGGCVAASCQACVCGRDGYCCQTAWDNDCATEALFDCATDCDCTLIIPVGGRR